MHRLIRIGTEALMEILRLVPSNRRHNTSKFYLEVLRIGNMVEIHFRFISSTFPPYFRFRPFQPE
jgi:hypothetical protein